MRPALLCLLPVNMKSLLLLTLLDQSLPPNRILNPTNPNPTPGDARMQQFEDVKGANWRVFSVNSFPSQGDRVP